MDSPKIQVGGSFPFIGGPENEKKFFEKFWIYSKSYNFSPGNARTLKLRI